MIYQIHNLQTNLQSSSGIVRKYAHDIELKVNSNSIGVILITLSRLTELVVGPGWDEIN